MPPAWRYKQKHGVFGIKKLIIFKDSRSNDDLYMSVHKQNKTISPAKLLKNQYDSPWKNVLNHFLQFFLELCLPELGNQIDWSKPYVALDKELLALSLKQVIGNRITDVLFKVFLKTGKEVWILLHIEVQASPETGFAKRMYVYHYRCFDRYDKPIISIAILADSTLNWRPSYYEQPPPFDISQKHTLRFEFLVVKLLDYKSRKEELIQSANPFSFVILAHLEALETRRNFENRLRVKIQLTRMLYKRGFSKEYVLNLFFFLDWVLTLPEPEEIKYTEQIEEIERANQMQYISSVERVGIQKGMQQGIQQGIQKGEALALIRLLEQRFGFVSEEYKSRIRHAESDVLFIWISRVLTAGTLEAVFKSEE